MQYHKIQTVFKRDPETNYKTLLEGEGIVARPLVELFARSGKRIITKLKTKDFQ